MGRAKSTGPRRGLAVAVVALAAVATAAVVAQEESKQAQREGKLATFLPEPTKYHEMLKKEAGAWDAEVKFWPSGPDGDPVVSEGSERNRMLPGGIWLVTEFQGELGGTRFVGHGIFGYESHKKKFVGTWVDTMSTGLMTLEGVADEQTGEIAYEGESADPITGQSHSARLVSRFHDDGTRQTTLFMGPRGGEASVKVMEIRYTRRPGDEAKKKGDPRKKEDRKKGDRKQEDRKKEDRKKDQPREGDPGLDNRKTDEPGRGDDPE